MQDFHVIFLQFLRDRRAFFINLKKAASRKAANHLLPHLFQFLCVFA